MRPTTGAAAPCPAFGHGATRAAVTPDHGWSGRHVCRNARPVQGTRWPGAWTGRHTGAERLGWSRPVSGAARTDTSCRRRDAASSPAHARRARTGSRHRRVRCRPGRRGRGGAAGSAAATPPGPAPEGWAGAPGLRARSGEGVRRRAARRRGVRGPWWPGRLRRTPAAMVRCRRRRGRAGSTGARRGDGLAAPDRVVGLGDPVQRLADIAAAAGVLEEDERGLSHGQRVAGLQPHGGRTGRGPGRPDHRRWAGAA